MAQRAWISSTSLKPGSSRMMMLIMVGLMNLDDDDDGLMGEGDG
jgi:hypothetical protein